MESWFCPPGLEGSARVGELFGEAAPFGFGDLAAEYEALRGNAAILPAPWERTIQVTGSDRRSFLQNLLTQDLNQLRPGLCLPGALADRKGHLRVDLWLLEESEAIRVRVRADRLPVLLQALDLHRFREKVDWSLDPEDSAAFLLLGPNAPAALAHLGAEFRPGQVEGGRLAAGGAGFLWLRIQETSPAEFLVCLPLSSSAVLWERLRGSKDPALPIGWDAFNVRRIERGTAWFGLDANEERLVPEAGLEDRISYEKGCYLGQETLSRLHYQGQLNWQIRPLRLETTSLPESGTELVDSGGARAGWITSAAVHPKGGVVTLAYLHRRVRETGGTLRLPSGEPLFAPADLPTDKIH